jgi:hypothetical protein
MSALLLWAGANAFVNAGRVATAFWVGHRMLASARKAERNFVARNSFPLVENFLFSGKREITSFCASAPCSRGLLRHRADSTFCNATLWDVQENREFADRRRSGAGIENELGESEIPKGGQ